MNLARAARAGALAAGLLLLASGRLAACDDFAAAPSSRWSVASRDGVAWLVTPCGRQVYSRGVNVLDGGAATRERDGRTYYSWTAFAPSLDAWVDATTARLGDWGFDTAGGWSLPPATLPLPMVQNLELGRLAKFHWFDPFDPATEAAVMADAPKLVAPYRGSPYRIGYFSDNEVGWWNGALFVFYSWQPATNHTKQRWVQFLRDYYGQDWARFAADFKPPDGVDGWDRLLAAESFTRLRPGSQGIGAVRAWTGIVARRYYTLMARAIHAADPDALYLGDRLPIYYDPVAVRAMADQVDVIATNYNVDSPDGWVARYFFDGLHRLSGGKPVLVSEWFFAANQNRTGNRNNGHLMTVETQAERAAGAAAATLAFAALPDVVGSHWFQYADHPKGGRADGEDYDFGLVDIDDRPYEELTAALSAANRAAPARHAAAAAPAAPARNPEGERPEISIPFAEIDVGDRSLRDWPKPAALLPPLVPSPGEVAFGEAYLAWNEAGLTLATIGQDYYDLDLLAYEGAFPLTEAYRVELGVDAGAGKRQFTLYFIPPRTKLKDHPPMSAMLCAGPAAMVGEPPPACRPVAGARTSYFGADQPRITSEMLLPWSALGLDAPPASGMLRLELAETAWHRSRWMSLSGLPPEQGRARPKRWTTIRLGRIS